MKIEAVVDRIEGDKAVLLTSSNIRDGIICPVNLLPREVKEGDVLWVSFELDPAATECARQEAAALLKELMEKSG